MGDTLLLPETSSTTHGRRIRILRELAQQRDAYVTESEREEVADAGYLVTNAAPYALTDTGRQFLQGGSDESK
jgi:hypothetical protein